MSGRALSPVKIKIPVASADIRRHSDTLRAANAAMKERFTGRKQNKRKRILLSSRRSPKVGANGGENNRTSFLRSKVVCSPILICLPVLILSPALPERVARRENGLCLLSLRQNNNPSFPGHAPGKDTLRAANAATKTRFTGRKRTSKRSAQRGCCLPVLHPSILLLSSSPQTRRIPARFRFRR